MAAAVTIARYITTLLAARLLVSLLAITALLQLFDLFNNARGLLSRGGTTADLVTYAWLRLPMTIEQAIPIAMLVGSLATLLSLSRANEITALRGAGVTVYRILLACAPTAVVAATMHFILIESITPGAERRFVDWWNGFEAGRDPANDERAIWARGGDSILRVHAIADAGERLNGLQIVELSEQGLVTRWINADFAQRTSEGWVLRDVRTTTVDYGLVNIAREDIQRWPSDLDPASVVEMASPTESLSIAQLRSILGGTSAGEHSPSYYLTRLHRTYAFPLASVLMVLLAAPAAYMIRRRGDAGRGLALGFGLGMAYLLADGLLSALGGAGALPPVLAAWAAPALFALVGTSVLLHYEE